MSEEELKVRVGSLVLRKFPNARRYIVIGVDRSIDESTVIVMYSDLGRVSRKPYYHLINPFLEFVCYVVEMF